MKKTLIALTVAVSAVVSGSAMAGLQGWSEGTTGGTVNVGGTITVDNTPVWLVTTGSGFSGFSNKDTDLTDGNKRLTVNAPEAIPVLAIRSKEAYTAGDYAKGTMPSVVISGGDGTAIAFRDWNNGSADISAPVYVNGAIAGTAKFKSLPTGAVAYCSSNKDQGIGLVVSNNGKQPTVLFSGIVGGGGEATGLSTTESLLSSLGFSGQLDETKRLAGTFSSWQDNQYMSGVTPSNINEKFNDDDLKTAAFFAGFGVKQNGVIDLAFTNAIQSTTTWTVPINVSVSYN
ncbi:K88 fimbrial protein AD [Escherichia coli]|uniref:F4 family fimbrial subunit n=1 Tax=Escherichia coli TaxID=562 RepID=UPI0010CC5D1A|nr:hypothetical protein [Escherichia coli]GCU67651.1 K88 fimbrial protein AD [Escherichia coli]GCZ35213.1 K88 fimbrial protein AD [Escherichia coli]